MNNYREEGRSMRPNHQNKRMRGRNRGGGGGGKGPNPLTRSYESNGPDVKVRGTAQNIAEKYVQLGRDAQASGDHVQAESFFQHAEHYFRLIAAAQEQYRIANPGFRGFDPPESDGEDGEEEAGFGQAQAQTETRVFNQADGEAEGEEEPQGDFQPREQRAPRPQRDHQPRENRHFQPREQRDHQPREQREFQPREQRDYQPRDQRPPRDGNRFERGMQERGGQDRGGQERRFQRPEPMPLEAEQPGLPSFITAPTRPVAMAEPVAQPDYAEAAIPVDPTVGEPIGIRRRGRPPRIRTEDEASSGE
jgi:Domain of unknown function (DUF4167)